MLHTGVVSRVTFRLLAGVSTAGQALRRLIPPVGLASALINTTPIVAMLIPAAEELEQRSSVPARQVLLPVAHATTLAGSATLIGTSSNLLIAGLAAPAGVGLTMFSFVPIAVPVALVGWLVLLLTAPLLLRGRHEAPERDSSWRVEIPLSDRANAIGRTAAEVGIDFTPDFELLEIRRWGERLDRDSRLQADDKLVYRATEPGVLMLWAIPDSVWLRNNLYAVSIATDEEATVRELEEGEDLVVVAAQSDQPLRSTAALPGAKCFVAAASADVLTDHPLVGLWQKVVGKAPQTGKTWAAVTILAAVITAGSFGIAPVELIAVAGATLMVLTGVLTPRSAARALNWNILAIIAGSVGLGTIVVKSGLGERISDAILTLSAGNTALVVAVFVLGTTVLTNVVTNSGGRGHPDPGRPRRHRHHRDRPGAVADADRDVHLVHVHQPVQPSVQPDGDGSGRLLDGHVRPVRHPADRGFDADGVRRGVAADGGLSQPASRAAAAAMRSSVAVSATRTCCSLRAGRRTRRGDEDAALGQPRHGVAARLAAGRPQVQPRIGEIDGEVGGPERRQQHRAPLGVALALLVLVLVVIQCGHHRGLHRVGTIMPACLRTASSSATSTGSPTTNPAR